MGSSRTELERVLAALVAGRSLRWAGGLLLAAAAGSTGCTCYGPCPPTVTVTRVITEADRIALNDESRAYEACIHLCETGSLPGQLPDASENDAGPRYTYRGRWTCQAQDLLLTCVGGPVCIGGRVPQALLATRVRRSRSVVGRFFAEMAHLEAAAVPAFEELAAELGMHGADLGLVRAARRSARQEIRHARTMQRLATRFGGTVPDVERGLTAPRSLVEMALDNAREGCVREAHGALLAAHQAARATDPEVRASFASIAREEAQHAVFSFALHDWARARLTPAKRRRVEEAREQAVHALAAQLANASETHPVLASIAGMPSATAAHDLAASLGA